MPQITDWVPTDKIGSIRSQYALLRLCNLGRRNMNKLYLFILLLMFSSNSMATDRASECATLTNDRARLNCYDALFQEPMETGTPAPKQLESMASANQKPSTRFKAKHQYQHSNSYKGASQSTE